METITIDIIDPTAIPILDELEKSQMIRVVGKSEEVRKQSVRDLVGKLSLNLTVEESDARIREMRNEWE